MRPCDDVVDVEPCSCTVDDDVDPIGVVVVVEPSSWNVVEVDAPVVLDVGRVVEVDDGALLVDVSGTEVVEPGTVVLDVGRVVEVDDGAVLVDVSGTEVVEPGTVVLVVSGTVVVELPGTVVLELTGTVLVDEVPGTVVDVDEDGDVEHVVLVEPCELVVVELVLQ